jgi:hypothetical protein
MRSFDWLSPGRVLGRFRSWWDHLARSLGDRRSGVLWAVVSGVVAVSLLLIYWGSSTLTITPRTYLGSGRHYSPDDLIRISRVLERQRIAYEVDGQRRVAVSSSQIDEAAAAIAKLDLGPRPPSEIREESAASSLWDSLHDRELRELQSREKILESMITGLDGIVGAFVRINRPKARLGLQTAPRPSAFVRLETEGDRQLPFTTVQSITTYLTGCEPDLNADAITVVDGRGHKYLDAGNPALSTLSHNRAREEELSEEILEKLDWIPGVRVSVQLPKAPPAVEPHGATESQHPGPSAGTPMPAATSRTVFAVNRPLGSVDSPGAAKTQPPPPEAAPSPPAAEPGQVWVRVPRSYYFHMSMFAYGKEPSGEELQRRVLRTEEQIKTGIAMVVPLTGPAAWKTRVDVIPDQVTLSPAPSVPPPAEGRRMPMDWQIAVAVGAMAAVLVTAGLWLLTTRRPSNRVQGAPRGLRYDGRSATAPGPSERVREFVRRNPESALSVLERWASQGGDPA